MSRRYYSQEDKHRYVWYCVQGITNLERRRGQVADLSEQHRLSDEQIAKLEEWLASLDAKRQEKEQQNRERASVSPIAYAIAHPTRNNLLNLRSGRDQFTNIRLTALRKMTGDQPEIDNAQLSDADKAAAYRWMLRGLPAALAMMKIVYGAELTERRKKRHHDEDEDDLSWQDQAEERQADQWRARNWSEPVVPSKQVNSEQADQVTTFLAGAKYHDTSKAVVGPVELEWEPTNPFDSNAIKITQRGIQLGYVPKDIAPTIRSGCTARLAAVKYPWTIIIEEPESFSFVLPKLLVGLE